MARLLTGVSEGGHCNFNFCRSSSSASSRLFRWFTIVLVTQMTLLVILSVGGSMVTVFKCVG